MKGCQLGFLNPVPGIGEVGPTANTVMTPLGKHTPTDGPRLGVFLFLLNHQADSIAGPAFTFSKIHLFFLINENNYF